MADQEKNKEEEIPFDDPELEIQQDNWEPRPPIMQIKKSGRKGWWTVNGILILVLSVTIALIASQAGVMKFPWLTRQLESAGILQSTVATTAPEENRILDKAAEIEQTFSIGVTRDDWEKTTDGEKAAEAEANGVTAVRYDYFKANADEESASAARLDIQSLEKGLTGIQLLIRFNDKDQAVSATLGYAKDGERGINIREYRVDGSVDEYLINVN